jgi:hypothetical protein
MSRIEEEQQKKLAKWINNKIHHKEKFTHKITSNVGSADCSGLYLFITAAAIVKIFVH